MPGHVVHVQQGLQRGAVGLQGLHRGGRNVVHHGQHGLRILQAKQQSLGAKELRQGHDHRAHLPQRHEGHRGFETLGQHHGHAVATLHAQRGQLLAHGVGPGLQFGKAVVACGGIGLVADDGHALAVVVRGPTLGAQLRDVHLTRDLPAKLPQHGCVVV